MSDGETPLVVTPAWLAAEGGTGSGVRVLDGSWHLPTLARDPAAEFLEAHIPGAAFFDIDSICDPDLSLPHMLPSLDLFRTQCLGARRRQRLARRGLRHRRPL